jgi:hypothetical protein
MLNDAGIGGECTGVNLSFVHLLEYKDAASQGGVAESRLPPAWQDDRDTAACEEIG